MWGYINKKRLETSYETMNESCANMNKPSKTEPSKTKKNIQYFKLPFMGKVSKFTDNKLQKLTKQFCKEGTNIKIVFSTFKLASFFSTKSHMV